MDDLEVLVALALLESHPRCDDLAALLEVARIWTDEAGQLWCLGAARWVYGMNQALEPFPVKNEVGQALEGVLNVFLNARIDARAWIDRPMLRSRP